MTRFTIASFNVKNLIGANKEYYKFQEYTPEEHAWKEDWLADQLLSMDADIVCFQEIFEEDALASVLSEVNTRSEALNAATIPDKSKRYHRRAIFRKLGVSGYADAKLAFAANAADTGEPGERRPGIAVVSRFGFAESPVIIQDLPEPLVIPFAPLRGLDAGEAGFFSIRRLSRPILKVKVPVGEQVVTVFNCHLKSKLGEYIVPAGADFAPEQDLTQYDAVSRALGSMRAATRRMAEAWVLRREIVAELEAGNPVMVMGDFNDGEHAVSSEIIAGEVPFKNYQWMLRHNAKHYGDRYTAEENLQIRGDVERMRLHSAEKLFVKQSLRDMVYTSAFGGVYESIDQIFMSHHFLADSDGQIGEMEYFSVFNDHITDGSHPEAPYNKLASDHGQIIAHIHMNDGNDSSEY
ncbi:endonuclease/exonuclease/phosphatase family protein [Lentibacter algarum]|uniref:endonuclease/exonuclease/phosphatase family protein n=1 Tax=Lentibacter algarum TaxID=576131 RepID=UPI001C0A3150|nr:endonuclease/exonuclease/phosphatase family protein [Lentibacter algarum]MBU2982811.1 endonuclease/exonuclease/phosphatase family protein [Lentibacter algarum]